jgi:oxygen-independent coproporphyrinogen-3 oxidase
MAGIYIHIPFCKQACTYCDFYFSTSSKMVNELVEGLIKEIKLQKDFFKNTKDEVIETIYFGGGTPSIIKPPHLQNIIETITSNFNLSQQTEVTIEVNPDDCNTSNIKAWQQMGVNRISCGVQSFKDSDLQFMNRTHNTMEAESAVKRLQDAGLSNISIDLIYGLPHMTDAVWAANLSQAKQLEVTHLSCYGLTVEEKTVLAHMVKKQQVKLDEQVAARNFEYLMDWSAQNDFEHYEISNLCVAGFESKHNSAYWKGLPYLGIGPSAHSYNGQFRQHNKPNMFSYLKALSQNKLDNEEEYLTFTERYHEKIMIGLRLSQGIAHQDITNYFDEPIAKHFQYTLNKHIDKNNIINTNDNFALSNQGKLIADYIIQDFFMS